ncbi:hypothetical protein LXL04_021334 [Taraxacum kok-saghyz]
MASLHSIYATSLLLLVTFQIFSTISEAVVRASDTFRNPFQLCFYNTTPNAFTVALRMGTTWSESIYRWVWEANRGTPVGENATLTFGKDGNLILADSDGRIACFDYLTDTLLVGQSLQTTGPTKMVGRASAKNNYDGQYSLVMEPKQLASYYKSPNSPNPILYWSSIEWFTTDKGSLTNLTLTSSPAIDDDVVHYLAQEECQLPERCGKFGLCEDSQCVACPTPNGLSGWTRECEAKVVTSCKVSDFSYYKLEGVDHFMIKYTRGDGGKKQSDCESKCTKDCKFMDYFYHTQGSRCWIAYDLKTLTRVGNSTHLATKSIHSVFNITNKLPAKWLDGGVAAFGSPLAAKAVAVNGLASLGSHREGQGSKRQREQRRRLTGNMLSTDLRPSGAFSGGCCTCRRRLLPPLSRIRLGVPSLSLLSCISIRMAGGSQ